MVCVLYSLPFLKDSPSPILSFSPPPLFSNVFYLSFGRKLRALVSGDKDLFHELYIRFFSLLSIPGVAAVQIPPVCHSFVAGSFIP